MCKIFKIIIAAFLFVSFAVAPSIATAQGYKGGYSTKKENKRERALKPAPRVFSSKLISTAQAEKLDVIYDNLFVSLWGYAATDFVYQKKLYTLIEPEKFQLTRYSKEFSGDLNASMDNLNKNYKKMLADIENAEEKYLEIKKGIKMVDHEILEPLWTEKISEFREKVDIYFKMEHKFLNTYKNLVGFIIKQAGSYYYKASDQRVYFYKFGGYQFYGQSIDKLRKISYEQRKLLKTIAPANINVKH